MKRDIVVITVPHGVCTTQNSQDYLTLPNFDNINYNLRKEVEDQEKIITHTNKNLKYEALTKRSYGFDCDIGSSLFAQSLEKTLLEKQKYYVRTIIPSKDELKHMCKIRSIGGKDEYIPSQYCDLNQKSSRNIQYRGGLVTRTLYRENLTNFLATYRNRIIVVIDVHSTPESIVQGPNRDVIDVKEDLIILDDKTYENMKKRSSKTFYEPYSDTLMQQLKRNGINVSLKQGIGNDIMDEVKNDFKLPCVLLEFNERVLDKSKLNKAEAALQPTGVQKIGIINNVVSQWIDTFLPKK